MKPLNAEAAADTIYRLLCTDDFQTFLLLEAPEIARQKQLARIKEATQKKYPQRIIEHMHKWPVGIRILAAEKISQITYMQYSIVLQILQVMQEQELIDKQCLIIGEKRDLPIWPGVRMMVWNISANKDEDGSALPD